ncbi:hypothetical protein ACEQPO_28625 [Bacillus sp. SL00103]
MKDGIKIVTIGEIVCRPELVEGFIKRYHELPVKELWLVDIEAGQEKVKHCGCSCETHGRKKQGYRLKYT